MDNSSFIATMFFPLQQICQKENCLTYTPSINLLLIQPKHSVKANPNLIKVSTEL